jgi:methionine-rich copper-binding protein CopC
MGQYSKSFRMFMATAATTAMVATAVTPVVASSFVDVSERYKEAVDYLVKQEITNGFTDTTFGVTQQIKRADAAVMIARALKLEGGQAPDAGFLDVPARAKNAVNALKQQGIINGKTPTNFGSDDTLTRGEMAIILSRAYSFKGEADVPFVDVNSRYMESVKALIANGITQGKSDTLFGTNQQITRGEFALFIFRSENPAEPKVMEVSAIEDIVVLTAEEVTLPSTVEVLMTGNKVTQKAVTWEQTDYSKPGEYIIEGAVADTDLKASVRVIVEESKATLAEKKAEEAIASLPEMITLEDEEAVVEARELVATAYELNQQVDIEGIELLEKAEATITFLHAKSEAEEAISALPETITLEDTEQVEAVREKVKAVYQLDAEATIEGIETLDQAEDKLVFLGAKSEAEEAISKLPAAVTLADLELVEAAREKVDAVYELNAEAEIEDIEVLETAEATVALLQAKQEAEDAIAALPQTITLADRASVETARGKVEAALQMDAEMDIVGLEKLEDAEEQIRTLLIESAEIKLNTNEYTMKTNKEYRLTATVTPAEVANQLDISWVSDNPTVATVDENGLVTSLAEGEANITAELENGSKFVSHIVVSNRPDLYFNTYASMTFMNEIKGVSTSFINFSEDTIHVQKVEVYEGSSKRSEYTEATLQENGFNTEIAPNGDFGMSITFRLGLWTSENNYVKYTIGVGSDSYEYISEIR